MRNTVIIKSALSLVFASAALSGCDAGINKGQQNQTPSGAFLQGITPAVVGSQTVTIDSTVDYGLALRTAALKLVGTYPTLAEMKALAAAADPATAYAAQIDAYLADPRFSGEQKTFWGNTFKMGGVNPVNGVNVNLDAAPTFAAMLVVKDLPFTQLFTATSGTCLAVQADGSFAAGTCPNLNTASTVGVLTDPGVQSQFFSSMAFRRVRWIQETFQCVAFPAEQSGAKVSLPGGTYASPWPLTSIAGPTAPINFQSDTSLICGNCHTTINHIAPLFGDYDVAGALQTKISVLTPVPGSPFTQPTDWLTAGQTTAWRYGKPVANIAALGQAIAEDPGTAACIASRVWNWGMSRGDIVNDLATLTPDLSAQLATELTSNNYDVKKLIRQVFTSASFVRF